MFVATPYIYDSFDRITREGAKGPRKKKGLHLHLSLTGLSRVSHCENHHTTKPSDSHYQVFPQAIVSLVIKQTHQTPSPTVSYQTSNHFQQPLHTSLDFLFAGPSQKGSKVCLGRFFSIRMLSVGISVVSFYCGKDRASLSNRNIN